MVESYGANQPPHSAAAVNHFPGQRGLWADFFVFYPKIVPERSQFRLNAVEFRLGPALRSGVHEVRDHHGFAGGNSRILVINLQPAALSHPSVTRPLIDRPGYVSFQGTNCCPGLF
jgi:hypothetical protein